MDSIIFADKPRGIYAKADGTLFFTKPKQFIPKGSPFILPTPFRIYVHKDIDPYAVVFANNGKMFVFDVQKSACVTTAPLPPFNCIIKKIQIFNEGKLIYLTSENQEFIYQNSWTVKQEDQDELSVKVEQKSNSQYAILEDEMCFACKSKDLNLFKLAVKRYAVYMALNSTIDQFMTNWNDLVLRALEISPDQGISIMQEVISCISGFEMIRPKVDDLMMTLCVF